MSAANFSVLFVKDNGSGFQTGATGLTLSEIFIKVKSINKTTEDVVTVLNEVNPTAEVGNGIYQHGNVSVDLGTYDYIIWAEYRGVTALIENEAWGNLSLDLAGISAGSGSGLSAGAIEYTYTVQKSDATPIFGVDVWITTDLAGLNVIWRGASDTFGIARDTLVSSKPMLDAGTYYIWRQKPGYIFNNPDTEVVA